MGLTPTLGKAATTLLVVALLSLMAVAVPPGAVHATTSLVISQTDNSACGALGGAWNSVSSICGFASPTGLTLTATSLTVESGVTLYLAYASSVGSGSSLILDSGATLLIGGPGALVNLGSVTNEAGGAITLDCSVGPCFGNQASAVLTNYGTLSILAYAGVGLYNYGAYPNSHGTVKNYGTVNDVAQVTNGVDIKNTGYLYNEASGTLDLFSYGSGAIALPTYGLLYNNGTITIRDSGQPSQGILVENFFDNYGTLNVDNLAPNSIGIDVTQYGTLTAESGSKTVIGAGGSGSYGISNTAGQYGIGTVVVNTGATMNVQNGAAGSEGIYNVYGVSNGLEYYANFTNSGTMTVSNGAFTTGIYNTANFENNGTLTVRPALSPATGIYTAGDFNSSGTLTVSGSANGVGISVGGGTLTDMGSLTVSNSGINTGVDVSGVAYLTDRGTLTVSNSGDNSTGVEVVQSATLVVDSGATAAVSNTGPTSVGVDSQAFVTVNPGGTMYLTGATGIAAALEVDFALHNFGTILSCPTLQAYVLDGSGTLSGSAPALGTFCPISPGSGSAYTVEVSVFGPGGSPVDDAVVSLNGDTGLTGLGDSIDFGLATSGTYPVTVTAPGFPEYSASVTVASYTTDLNITLGATSSSSSGSASGALFTSGGASQVTTSEPAATASFTNTGTTSQSVDVWFVWSDSAGQVVDIGGEVSVQFNAGQTITFTGTYGSPGSYTVKAFVTTPGGTGLSISYSATVNIV